MRLTIINKYINSLLFLSLAMLLVSACNDDSTGPRTEELQIETHTVADLPADTAGTGAITYFSLRENSTVEASDSASTDWDIAFSGTTIYTNSGSSGPGDGGAIVLDQSFDATITAPSNGLNTDTESQLAIPAGDENGWYNYTNTDQIPNHAILPIENKTIVLRTTDGQYYAKMQILSYYKGNPEISNDQQYPPEHSRFYTFKYAIQMNGSTELN